MNAHHLLKRFFWGAFAVFLLASIPHVAYFFRSFEPEDGMWHWLIAYAIALSIDITTFLLSLTVAELRRKRVNNWLVGSVWMFIAALAALSWFINWEYATQFTSSMLARPESIGIVHFVNPMIASCFQVLAIAYTWISDKIGQSEQGSEQVNTQVNAVTEEVNSTVNVVNNSVNSEDYPVNTELHLVTSSELEVTSVVNKREQIVHLLTSGGSVNTIAEEIGVSKSYVSRIKKELSA